MKKFRILSTVLAALMVLSVFSGITVSAKQIDSNTFFCDFEEFELGKAAAGSKVYSDSGIKWTRFYYSGDSTYYNTPDYFKIVSDETYGKGIQPTTQPTYLGFGLPDNVTTGKVRLAFSLKAGTWGNLQGVFKETGYAGTPMANIGTAVTVRDTSSGYVGTGKELTTGNWYYVECVVDLDANSWTFYVDGELVNSFTMTEVEEGVDPMSIFRGFSFYCGSATGTLAVIDNVTVNKISTSDAALNILETEITETDGGNTQIKMVLSDSVSGDVTLSQCGGSDVEIDRKINHNLVTLTTKSGTLDDGYEYMVTIGNDNFYVCLPLESDVVKDKDTGIKNFDDVTTKQYPDRTVYEVENEYVVGKQGIQDGILTWHNFRAGDKAYPGVYKDTLSTDDTSVGTNNASGTVIYPKGWSVFRLLKPLKATYGTEVYEFDFKWTNSGANFDLKTTSDLLIARVGSANTWKHMRIEYDRAKNTATSYVDGVLNKTVQTTDFEQMLKFETNSSSVVFYMDNYQSYVEYSPLTVESVRYTAGTETTGANLISPETTKIDITFNDAVKESTLSGITLTADGKTITPHVTVSGKVVTLNIDMLPANKDVVLTIPETVTSETGIPLHAARTYSVKTADTGKFEVSGLDIKVNGAYVTGETTTGENGATVTVTADVLNTKAVDHDITVIYAFYNDDELVDVWYKDFDLDGKYHLAISETDTSEANVTYDKVKAFVWDGLTTRVPKAVSVSYPAN